MMNENSNFIKTIMKNELENGVVDHILTRFPPEPNAYLHIGHARAIINNFELSKTTQMNKKMRILQFYKCGQEWAQIRETAL